MTTPNTGAPLWPSNFQGCRVKAQYLTLAGLPVSGTVTFSASPASLLDPDVDLIIVPRTYTATLDVNGSFTIVLPATDDPDINPNNFTYSVSENFVGGRQYNIRAPQNTVVDLSEVSPVPSSNGVPILRGPQGPAGGIQMVNGHTGDIVTISYADVGADIAGAAASVNATLSTSITNLTNSSLQKSANLSGLTNVATARTNLGLGSIATHSTTEYEPIGGYTAMPIGAICMWPTITAPPKFFNCDGTAISRTTYATLFGILGTTYGAGNGTTTFNLPSVKQRFIMGMDPSITAGPPVVFHNYPGNTGGSNVHSHSLSDAGKADIWFNSAKMYGVGTTALGTSYVTTDEKTFTGTTGTSGNTVFTGAALDGFTDDSDGVPPPFIIFNVIIRAI